MPKLSMLFGIVLSSTVAAQDLTELSTSIDFEIFVLTCQEIKAKIEAAYEEASRAMDI